MTASARVPGPSTTLIFTLHVSNPGGVRATAIGLTVLAHLLVLLALGVERGMPRREVARELPQFVSFWRDSQPPPVQPQTLQQPAVASRLPSVPGGITLVVAPQEPAAIFTPAPSSPPAATDPTVPPSVDWVTAGRAVAARVVDNYGLPDTFSPLANIHLPATVCAPRKISAAVQAKMDELLPPPVDLVPAPSGPEGSVMMPGGIRVGIMKFSALRGRRAALLDPPDLTRERPDSSVPDPDTCD